jgi:hypothetical protein
VTSADERRRQIVVCPPFYAAGLAISPCGAVELEQEVRKMVERANICTAKHVEVFYLTERMCDVEGSFEKAFSNKGLGNMCAWRVARRQRSREQLSLEQRRIRAPVAC